VRIQLKSRCLASRTLLPQVVVAGEI